MLSCHSLVAVQYKSKVVFYLFNYDKCYIIPLRQFVIYLYWASFRSSKLVTRFFFTLCCTEEVGGDPMIDSFFDDSMNHQNDAGPSNIVEGKFPCYHFLVLTNKIILFQRMGIILVFFLFYYFQIKNRNRFGTCRGRGGKRQ